MGTIEGLTKDRMLAIEAASVVDADLETDGDLIFTKHDGTQINAGNVMVTLPMLRDMLYPVGTIYLSAVATSPATLFGGTWVAWGAGRVPVGYDASQTEFNAPEKTGGAKTVTLTAAESGLPAHTHVQNAHTHVQDAHNHTQNSHNHTQAAHYHNHPNSLYKNIVVQSGTGNTSMWGGPDVAVATSSDVATNIGTTATNNASTATNQSTTAVNQSNTAASATSAHNNLQPYITAYMWKRTA